MSEQRKELKYKNTEIGLIPEDWSITNLGKVGQFSKGKGIRKDEVHPDGIPCVRYGELYTKYNNLITSFHSYISEEVANESCQIKEGDILFAGSGETREEIGKCAALIYSDRVYAGGDIIILRPINYDSTFLGYLLNAPIVAKQKSIKGQGDAVVHIYSSGLYTIKIPVPSKREQRAIATALSDVDTLISNLNKLIAKKKAIKKGAMQRLLKSPEQGGQRLPGFQGEWQEVTLGHIISKHQLGGNYSNSEVENSYPLIKMGNLNRGSISLSKLEFISNNSIPNEIDRLRFGDLLFNTRNTLDLVGKIAIWRNELNMAFFNSNIMRIEFKEAYVGSTFFMNYLLNTKKYLAALKALATGTTSVAAIYTRDLLTLGLLIPSPEEQKAIATILSDMDKEIESLEIKKSKYLCIKHGMMQELLTGKTRLV